MNKTVKQGFTLTELMVVVVILSILMGIAAGGYRKATERSHFSEGLTAAHTVLSAVERYHDQHPNTGDTSTWPPKIANLDVALTHAAACTPASDQCVMTKYFVVTVQNNGSVTAVRKGNRYTITVYPESFGGTGGSGIRYRKDTCTGKDGNADFCISVGYTDCAGAVCQKN